MSSGNEVFGGTLTKGFDPGWSLLFRVRYGQSSRQDIKIKPYLQNILLFRVENIVRKN
jgi:hypothetical protein